MRVATRIKQGVAAFKVKALKAKASAVTYVGKKAHGFRSNALILGGYAFLGWGAYDVNTTFGLFATGFLLLVLERSVESGDER